MIPDYLTFIRFQDKRNLLFIYIVTFVLLGFYWKNAGFSFTRQDVWLASAIFALILYSFTADLKAFWAYKCVVKNVDLSIFLKKEARPTAPIVYDPLVAMVIATLVFAGISALMLTGSAGHRAADADHRCPADYLGNVRRDAHDLHSTGHRIDKG